MGKMEALKGCPCIISQYYNTILQYNIVSIKCCWNVKEMLCFCQNLWIVIMYNCIRIYISPMITALLLATRKGAIDNCSIYSSWSGQVTVQQNRRNMYSQCKISSSHSQSHKPTHTEVGHWEPFKVIVYYWSSRSTVWGQCGGKTTDPYAPVCEKLCDSMNHHYNMDWTTPYTHTLFFLNTFLWSWWFWFSDLILCNPCV